MQPRKFIKQLHHDNLVTAIREAEKITSGEIRVLVSHRSVDDPVVAAQKEFMRLGMTKSAERNGVLIFVAPRARKFAVIGDEAVHAKCGDEFWQKLAEAMTDYFRKSEFTAGIIHGVKKAGELQSISRESPTIEIKQFVCVKNSKQPLYICGHQNGHQTS